MNREPPAVADIISPDEADTLPGLLHERARRSPTAIAYRQYDKVGRAWVDYTWKEMNERVEALRRTLSGTNLEPGERVAILLPNSVDWVAFDLAALSSDLITVPLYCHDSAANVAGILEDSGARLAVIDTWVRLQSLLPHTRALSGLQQVWVDDTCERRPDFISEDVDVLSLSRAIQDISGPVAPARAGPDDLATLIYTSGTTGRPKGVMLSHSAILWNAHAITAFIPPLPSDIFLSVLPLAHAFERTIGCYLPMMAGARVAFARSIETLREDLAVIRPTILLAVPRLYERIHETILRRAPAGKAGRKVLNWAAGLGWRVREWRYGRSDDPGVLIRSVVWPVLERALAQPVLAAFGGRVRVAVSGGAPLPTATAQFLAGLGLPLVEGYGLTEAGPVVTATTTEDSVPGSVGRALHGLEARLDARSELLVRSPSVMKGYWRNPETTSETLTADGWLRTGDVAAFRDGRIEITGRLKEIIVLSTGEKVVPTMVEAPLEADPLFAQVCVVGEGRPCLVAIAVLDPTEWSELAGELGIAPTDVNAEPAREKALARMARATRNLSKPSQVRAVHLTRQAWTIEDGTLTPTLKIKRAVIEDRYTDEIDELYARLAKARSHLPSGG